MRFFFQKREMRIFVVLHRSVGGGATKFNKSYACLARVFGGGMKELLSKMEECAVEVEDAE